MVGKRKTLMLWGTLLLPLAACGVRVSGPVTWWHDYEGGAIAQNRPPPPGAHAPYPNFAQLPQKPATLPAAERQDELRDLAETRDLALAGAAAAPLPVAATAARPAAAKPGALTVSSAAATPTAAAPAAPASPQLAAPTVADIDHPPELAPAPPNQAALADVAGALGNPAVIPGDFNHLMVGFDNGSDLVPREAAPGLIAFAQAHQKKIIRITGYGGQGTGDAALALGWRRANAVAAALIVAGVPASDLRLAGEAPGTGAALAVWE